MLRANLIIERLEFPGRCGLTVEEREVFQPMAVDLELEYAAERAAATDDIALAVDYGRVVARLKQVASAEQFRLIEAFAARLAELILAEFPVLAVRLWLRKLKPPITDVGSVGVRLERRRTDRHHDPGHEVLPAAFLTEQVQRLPKGLALDVAAGRGRNALYLAAHGWTVEALDRDEEALATLAQAAQERHLATLTVRRTDLEADPVLPAARYDLVVVCFYLQRSLFPALLKTLKPGGMLLYETFLIDNHLRYQHPRRKEFCLEHNELLRLTSPLRVLHYEEGEREGSEQHERAITARLLAQWDRPPGHRPERLRRSRRATRRSG
jgi:dihydroneopterin aldolase